MNFRTNGYARSASANMPAGWFRVGLQYGYTARMRKIIVAVVFIVIALWLGIYVVPDLIANMLPGEP